MVSYLCDTGLGVEANTSFKSALLSLYDLNKLRRSSTSSISLSIYPEFINQVQVFSYWPIHRFKVAALAHGQGLNELT